MNKVGRLADSHPSPHLSRRNCRPLAHAIRARHACHMLDPFAPDSYIVRGEAHIIGIEPRISRTLELPMALNRAQLHEVLQASFGWTDSHLHQFNIGGIIYGAPEFDDDGFTANRIFEADGRFRFFLRSRRAAHHDPL